MDNNDGGERVPGRQRERWERGKACNMCNRVIWYVILCNVVLCNAYGGSTCYIGVRYIGGRYNM